MRSHDHLCPEKRPASILHGLAPPFSKELTMMLGMQQDAAGWGLARNAVKHKEKTLINSAD